MTAGMGHLGLTFAVVAIVTHVLGVVLLVGVRTLVDLPAFSLTWDFYSFVIFFLGHGAGLSGRLGRSNLVFFLGGLTKNFSVFFYFTGSIISLRNLVNVPGLGVIHAFLPHASLIILVYLI